MADKKRLFDLLEKHKIDWNLVFPEYLSLVSENGIPIYAIKGSKPGLVYCEWIFENGRIAETKKLTARVTANQIQEGTLKYNTKAVADFFDFYGCAYSIQADLDFTSISISCLQKHFEVLSAFVVHLITKPVFLDENLKKGIKSYLSQLLHQTSEPDFVSYRELTSQLFGTENVYGYNSTENLFRSLKTEDLKDYHSKNYVSDCLKVFYSGGIFDGFESFWNQLLSSIPKSNTNYQLSYQKTGTEKAKLHFPMPHCAQTSLKIGRRLWSKTHPDYFGFYVMNAILGDYFGSRLMKNIREDKGLTYDIHSTLDSQIYDGCFYVSAELNPKEMNRTIQLVNDEFKLLQTQFVSEKELTMVKNYLYGHILRLLDGSFQSILFLKILISEYKEASAFHTFLHKIENISPAEIQQLAQTYLNMDEMSVITAGKDY